MNLMYLPFYEKGKESGQFRRNKLTLDTVWWRSDSKLNKNDIDNKPAAGKVSICAPEMA